MTHEERARGIVREWANQFEAAANGGSGAFGELERRIATGMAEASNAELERRRAVEAERDRLQYVFRLMTTRHGDYPSVAWLREFLERKAKWSEKTFGPGVRTKGIIAHIRKELEEIEADPLDLMEWVDVFMLATDGFWRACVATHCVETPDRFWFAACCFIERIQQKHAINEARQWPKPTSEDVPVEHVREAE